MQKQKLYQNAILSVKTTSFDAPPVAVVKVSLVVIFRLKFKTSDILTVMMFISEWRRGPFARDSK